MMIASSGISSRFGQKAPQFVENFRRTPVCLEIKTCSVFFAICKIEWLRSSSWPSVLQKNTLENERLTTMMEVVLEDDFSFLSGGFLGSMFNHVNFPG